MSAIASIGVSDVYAVQQGNESGNHESWNQWRGPHRDGTTPTSLPSAIDEGNLERLWRIELGPSYSGPLVDDQRIYVTETVDERDEVVRAFDRQSGDELWAVKWTGSIDVPFFARENGDWIRSTPALDEDRLYVAGIRDVLVCLDVETGDEIWKLDFPASTRSEVPTFGCATSPMILGDHVFIQAGDGLSKVNKYTGDLVWRTLRDQGGMMGGAFSSPVIATIHGREQLVVQTRTTLAGADMESGEVLWKIDVPNFRGMNILTPTVVENRIFTSSYGNRSYLYEVTVDGSGQWDCQLKWEHRQQGYMSSPVVVDGHIYLHLRNGRFTCIDWETGEAKWTTTPFGKYWSLVTDGERILALDQRGELILIEVNADAYEQVGSRRVSDDSWAHLAVSGSDVVIRELNALSVYRTR